MNETWRPVNDFPELFEISDMGNVRKAIDRTPLKVTVDKITGYSKISFYVKGKIYTRTIHRLVAEVFIENPDKKPQVHHINENKQDNRASNLMWVTPMEHGRLRSEESVCKFREAYRRNTEIRKNRKNEKSVF